MIRLVPLALALVLASAPAAAETRTQRKPQRYAQRIALADGAAVAGGALGIFIILLSEIDYYDESESGKAIGTSLLVAGVATYVAVPFLVHLRRDNPGGATRSALARVGLPLIGGILGYAIEPNQTGPSGRGIALGVASAMLLDWTVFARIEQVNAVPFVAPGAAGGMQVGFAAQF